MANIEIKQEEQPIILSSKHLYTISPSSTPPPEYEQATQTQCKYKQFTGIPCMTPQNAHPEIPLAKSVRGVKAEDCSLPSMKDDGPSFYDSFVRSPYPLSERPATPSPLEFKSLPSTPPRAHVPRPPNAFMLFRSDFLKRRIVPSYIERRQQNLSRIAGEVWNLKPAAEKDYWHEKAAQVLLEHQQKNPNYKFTPAPRGSRRGKGKGRVTPECAGADRIREIRETYAQVPGPAAPPSRRRKCKDKTVDTSADSKDTKMSCITPPTISIPPSPSSEPSLSPCVKLDQTFPNVFYNQTTPRRVDVPRRPSTSLGFATASNFRDTSQNFIYPNQYMTNVPFDSPGTKLSHALQGLDIAPAAANASSVSMPSSPIIDPMLHAPAPNTGFAHGLEDALQFSVSPDTLLQNYQSASFQNASMEDTSNPFLNSFNSNDQFGYSLAPSNGGDFSGDFFFPSFPFQAEASAEHGSWSYDIFSQPLN